MGWYEHFFRVNGTAYDKVDCYALIHFHIPEKRLNHNTRDDLCKPTCSYQLSTSKTYQLRNDQSSVVLTKMYLLSIL